MPTPIRIALIAILLLVSPVAWAATCHHPPVPVIDWVGTLTGCTPGSGSCAKGEPINFFALAANGGSFQPCDVLDWDFGDGIHSALRNPTHTFVSAGSFAVFLLVTNDTQIVEGSSRPVPVTNTVLPSIVAFTVTPTRVSAGHAVVFSWNTRNTSKGVRIENVHPSSVPATLKETIQQSIGTFSFIPRETMTYTLTAYGDAAQLTSSAVAVEVVAAPKQRAVRH